MNNRIEWWEDPANKETFPLPISVVFGEHKWVASTNTDTGKYLGNCFRGVASGKTKEEAIERLFLALRIRYKRVESRSLEFERWVPLRVGNWSRLGGTWFQVFGINIYFRYGDNKKRGWYVPLTKLNIMVTNLWKTFREYKNKQQNEISS